MLKYEGFCGNFSFLMRNFSLHYLYLHNLSHFFLFLCIDLPGTFRNIGSIQWSFTDSIGSNFLSKPFDPPKEITIFTLWTRSKRIGTPVGCTVVFTAAFPIASLVTFPVAYPIAYPLASPVHYPIIFPFKLSLIKAIEHVFSNWCILIKNARASKTIIKSETRYLMWRFRFGVFWYWSWNKSWLTLKTSSVAS